MSRVVTEPEKPREAFGTDAMLKAGSSDPEWLRARRAEAWDIYLDTPLPSTQSEEWRYTDLSRLLPMDALVPADPGLGAPPARNGDGTVPAPLRRSMAQDRHSAGRIVEVDGAIVEVELNESLSRQGVVLTSLRKAARSGDPLVERFLAT